MNILKINKNVKVSDVEYADDLALLANTPTQADNLDHTAGTIGLKLV